MVKGIIFDLDGTLLDTSEDIRKVLNCSLKKFGLSELSAEKIMEYVGNGAFKLVERAVGERTDLLDDIYRDYVENFNNCDNELTVLYSGEAEALKKFVSKGIKLAIITNKPQKAADGVCKKHLSQFKFSKIIGHSPDFALKPSADSALNVIKEWNIGKEEILFVGDGETDVFTAKNAGVKCVSVLWGFRSRRQLEDAGGNLFATDYSELCDIVFDF